MLQGDARPIDVDVDRSHEGAERKLGGPLSERTT
jgi:hypothetical protein